MARMLDASSSRSSIGERRCHLYLTYNWRASVASETLTGVKMKKSGMFVYLYIYGRTYVILYFDPPYFGVRSAFDPVPNFTKQNPPV